MTKMKNQVKEKMRPKESSENLSNRNDDSTEMRNLPTKNTWNFMKNKCDLTKKDWDHLGSNQ